MSTFSYLKKAEIKLDALPYIFDEIEGEPTLMVRFAGEKNKPYFNAMLRSIPAAELKKMQRGNISSALAQKQREADRKNYAGTVVVGWVNVTDAEGGDVDFTPELAAEFLEALPDYLFDELRDYCTRARNFTPDAFNAEDAAKN